MHSRTIERAPFAVLIPLLAATLPAQPAKPSPVLAAMKAEITSSMAQFKQQQTPPYFLSYEIIENETAVIAGSFGTLIASRDRKSTRLNSSHIPLSRIPSSA